MASINITEVRNPKYISPRGDIDLEINHPEYGWIEYTISLDDDDETIDNDNLTSLASAIGIAAMDQTMWDNRIALGVRDERNFRLLHECDPLVTNPLRWEALTTEKQQEWRQYRQALLDVPQQEEFPHTVTWPTKPE